MPSRLAKVLKELDKIKSEFNTGSGNRKVSLADLIVLGGCAAIEKSFRDAGLSVNIPFIPGRMDATQEQTDSVSFEVLEPIADGFRNYVKDSIKFKPEKYLVDKAQLLNLTVPEMTVLVGGMRVLDANYNNSKTGVFTSRPGTLTNDFFVNLLDMETEWKPADESRNTFEGFSRRDGKLKWKASRVDLIFGSHSELRAVAEVYASSDGSEKFVKDFVAAWNKVMNLDRFDIYLKPHK